MNEWEWSLLEDTVRIESLEVTGGEVKVGDYVWLRPRPGADVFDVALAGQMAAVEAFEQDVEGNTQVAVVVDADPGKDLGLMRLPGHRFFFRPDEVARAPRILVAGIGNIFFGDDGFGVEVAKQIERGVLPGSVRVVDFGIRGFDLACALLDGYDLSILVDASARGGQPGTIYVIEPDLHDIERGASDAAVGVEAHGLTPASVLRLAATMDGCLGKVLVVGCEPESLGGEDGRMGLSDPVAAAIPNAIAAITALVNQTLEGPKPQ